MLKIMISFLFITTIAFAQGEPAPTTIPQPNPVSETTTAVEDTPGTIVKPTRKQKASMKKVAKKAKKNAKEMESEQKAESEAKK